MSNELTIDYTVALAKRIYSAIYDASNSDEMIHVSDAHSAVVGVLNGAARKLPSEYPAEIE